ncbi:MAG: hypothetical protein IJG37_09505 [Synergistaceae bacterium]|nr:hypothetical protein [Synergistaceae bacterium]MBQ3653084.1 hypothetical protein [Synergistaceae bacterium]MBR0034566.1 hypothetical protein [Synergistaceae bacterium]
MPATIINVPEVNDSIDRAHKQLEEQKQALERIDGVVSSMEESWDSESQKVYAERFRDAKQRIQQFNESVNDSLTNMKEFVERCVDYDSLTAQEIRNVQWRK